MIGMKRTIPRVLAILMAAALLTACYESADVTRLEPGVYKGEGDPLTSKLEGDTALREQLNQRFDGQRDR